jgi:hypothetical protein
MGYKHRVRSGNLDSYGHVLGVLVGIDLLDVNGAVAGGPGVGLPSHERPLLDEEVTLESVYLRLQSTASADQPV